MPTDLPDTSTGAPSGPALVQPQLRWAVVDLMGHACIAGAISTEEVGGAKLVRVDVPEVATADGQIEAHARSFSAAAVYSIAWCTEAAADAAARLIKHTPPTAPEADHAQR